MIFHQQRDRFVDGDTTQPGNITQLLMRRGSICRCDLKTLLVWKREKQRAVCTLARTAAHLPLKRTHADGARLESEGLGRSSDFYSICSCVVCLATKIRSFFIYIFEGMDKLKKTCQDAK